MTSKKAKRAIELASRFKAYKAKSGTYEIGTGAEGVDHIRTALDWQSADVTVTTALKSVTWVDDRDGQRHFVSLEFLDLSVGFSAEEGWSSSIVEDCLFVIDGNTVRHLPIASIHVSSEAGYAESNRQTDQRLSNNESTSSGINGNPSYAAAKFSYIPPSPGFWQDEFCELSIGLPDAAIEKLVELALKGLQASVILHGIAAGRSSSMNYGVARDLFLIADGEPLNFLVDSVGIQIHTPNAQIGGNESLQDNLAIPTPQPEPERVLPVLHQLDQSISRLRSTVVTVAWALGIVLLVLAFRH